RGPAPTANSSVLLDSPPAILHEVPMRRIGLMVLLAVSALGPRDVAAQEERTFTVGLLTLGADPSRSGFWQKFMESMRELNYVEGRNLVVRRSFADGNRDRLPSLVAALVPPKLHVILPTSTHHTLP